MSMSESRKKLEQEYKKQLRRIKRWVREREKEGVFLRPGAIPDQPKRITQASISRLEKITPAKLWSKAEVVDPVTGNRTKADPPTSRRRKKLTEDEQRKVRGRTSGRREETRKVRRPPAVKPVPEKKPRVLSPEAREKIAERMRKQWQDPAYRQRMLEQIKKRWEDPAYRQKTLEHIKKRWEDPEYRRKQSELAKKRWEDPEYRKKMSELAKKRWQDPEYREKMRKALEGKRKGVKGRKPQPTPPIPPKEPEPPIADPMPIPDTLLNMITMIDELCDSAEVGTTEAVRAEEAKSLFHNQLESEGTIECLTRIADQFEELYNATYRYIFASRQSDIEEAYDKMVSILLNKPMSESNIPKSAYLDKIKEVAKEIKEAKDLSKRVSGEVRRAHSKGYYDPPEMR